MKRIIDTSEALGLVHTPEGPSEWCATAPDASYGERVGAEESAAMAREIFQRRVRKVRATTPTMFHPV